MANTKTNSNFRKSEAYTGKIVLLRLLKYSVKYRWALFFGAISTMSYSGISSSIPLSIKYTVEFLGKNVNLTIYEYVLFCGFFVFLFAFKGIFFYLQTLVTAKISQKVCRDIREAFFSKLLHLSFHFFNKRHVGDLITRFSNDISIIEQGLMSIAAGPFRDMIIFLSLIGYMSYISLKLTLVCSMLVPSALLLYIFARINRRIVSRRQEGMSLLLAIVNEVLHNIRLVKSFTREVFEYERFEKRNTFVMDHNIKSTRIFALATPIIEFSGSVFLVLLMFYGIYLLNQGELTSGELLAFVISFFTVILMYKNFNGFTLRIQDTIVSCIRVFEILDIADNIEKSEIKKTKLPKIDESISVKIDSFSYENKVILHDIDVKIKKGNVVAIVGKSGSGKTTFVNLLSRFFELDPSQGRIFFDQNDIRNYSVYSLREQISLVAQETLMFNDTVYSNIAYGKNNASREEVLEASKKALVHEFVQTLDNGYEQQVGDKGFAISGGQGQRIAIARAILKNAPILVLDEATNALDSYSEKIVNQALNNLMEGRTTIIVAHKYSAIEDVDHIFVFKDGAIVEEGNFQHLIKKKGEFNDLYSAYLENK